MFLRLDLQAVAGATAEESVAGATGAGLDVSSNKDKDAASVPWVPNEPENREEQDVQEVQTMEDETWQGCKSGQACVIQGG